MNNQSNFDSRADFEFQLSNAQANGDTEAFELILMMGEEDNVYGEERVAPEPEAEWEAPEVIEYASETAEPAEEEEDFSLDISQPLPITDNPEDFEEVQDKLKEMGIPPLTAIVAPTHGDWNAINKMMAIEKATTLLINMRIQAHADDKAMWQAKIDAKNREMAALVASVNSLLNPTRPIYVADALRKKDKPLGYSQTAQFQHSGECLAAWRFGKVDEYVSKRDWKHAQSQLVGIVEGIELLFPGTLADIVDTVRRIRNSKPDGLIKAVEKARAKYMPMISDGHETCAALHVQKETV